MRFKIFYLSLLLFSFAVTIRAIGCEDNWIDATEVGLGCLQFHPVEMTWWEASKHCQEPRITLSSLHMSIFHCRL